MKQRYTVPLKRKRLGRTNYKKRIKFLKSGQPRLIARKSLNHMSLQIAVFDTKGDKIIASAHSKELEQFGWKINKGNIPAAYLTGILLGTKAKKKDIKNAILDLGLQTSVKGSRVYAAVKGCIDAGIEIPVAAEILPDEDRLHGKHIASYCTHSGLKSPAFSHYGEKSVKAEHVPALVDEIKNQIKKKVAGG